jgi:hypothetical protein
LCPTVSRRTHGELAEILVFEVFQYGHVVLVIGDGDLALSEIGDAVKLWAITSSQGGAGLTYRLRRSLRAVLMQNDVGGFKPAVAIRCGRRELRPVLFREGKLAQELMLGVVAPGVPTGSLLRWGSCYLPYIYSEKKERQESKKEEPRHRMEGTGPICFGSAH